MKPMRAFQWLALLVLLAVSGCVLPSPPIVTPPPIPIPAARVITLAVMSEDGSPVAGPLGSLNVDEFGPAAVASDTGEIRFTLPVGSPVGHGVDLLVSAPGFIADSRRVLIPVEDTLQAIILKPVSVPTVEPLVRLRMTGRRVSAPAGFVWRGITAFRLLDYVADGEPEKAADFLRQAKGKGFNVARVLATLCCWFRLSTLEGQAALPELLTLAAHEGVYVEVVALAGTADERTLTKDQMRQQARAVGEICAQMVACGAIELANENAHSTQSDDLKDIAFLRELRRLIPSTIPVSMGSNAPPGQSDEEEIYPGGDFITVHRERSRDTWNYVRHIRELEVISNAKDLFVVDDEPKGAGEVDSGSRSTNPHEFFAVGALCRVFDLGCTLHLEAGLQAIWPAEGSKQAASIVAWIDGTRVVPDDVHLSFQNANWATSPVKSSAFSDSFGKPNTATRIYSGISGNRGIAVLVGVTGQPSIAWQNGWTPGAVLADRPGVRVLEIGK